MPFAGAAEGLCCQCRSRASWVWLRQERGEGCSARRLQCAPARGALREHRAASPAAETGLCVCCAATRHLGSLPVLPAPLFSTSVFRDGGEWFSQPQFCSKFRICGLCKVPAASTCSPLSCLHKGADWLFVGLVCVWVVVRLLQFDASGETGFE